MSDPMLAKAKALERALLYEARYQDDDGELMHRAALLIQQMRVRLESLQRDGVE